MAGITDVKFRELLERARASATAQEERKALDTLSEKMKEQQVTEVDISGITGSNDPEQVVGDEHVEVIKDIIVDHYNKSDNSQHNILHAPQVTTTASKRIGVSRDDITLNDKQQSAHDKVVYGRADTIIIGAAGTGKTTSMRKITQNLIQLEERLPKLKNGTKWLLTGHKGGAIVSFTRKAVNNIRHAVVDDLKPHTLTLHKLLEYGPVFYEIEDPANPGAFKNTMRFEPARHATNPLPSDLIFIAFEESSMISVELYQKLQAAMPHPHQEVFLGDIQQLPPIFGLAILGFKMLELETIEYTEVYRQALESPIIDLAWKVLEGNSHIFNPKLERVNGKLRSPAYEALSRATDTGTLKINIWVKPISADNALITAAHQFNVWAEQGYYKPEEDIILCPFNKAFGTIEMNKSISQYLGVKRGAIVYEVIAGFNKHYLAVGDRVLYDKEDAFITSIRPNGSYLGQRPMAASVHLTRYGRMEVPLTEEEKLQAQIEDSTFDLEAIDKFLEASATGLSEDRVNSASHVIGIRYAYQDDDELEAREIVLDSANDINNLLGGYCITVHKFQGSEADRVFLLLHQSHANMVCRELLYTAVTRAKRFLHIICEPNTFFKGVKSQRIRGNTLKEKAQFFKGKEEAVREQGILDLKHNSLTGVYEVPETLEARSDIIEEFIEDDAGPIWTVDTKPEPPQQVETPLQKLQKLAALNRKVVT